MAVKDYREMYIKTILSLCKEKGLTENKINRSYLANLNFNELKGLAEKLNS